MVPHGAIKTGCHRTRKTPRSGNHDLLSALEFNGIGGSGEGEFNPYAQSGKTPDDLMERLVLFGQSIGIRKARTVEEIQGILELAPAYRQEAREILFSLPEADRSGVSPHVEGLLGLLEEIAACLARLKR